MKKWIFCLVAFFLMTTMSWGATYTLWVDGTLRNPIGQKVIEINDYMRVYKHQINFVSQTLDAGDADVAQIILLPKNCMVLKAWIRVVTAAPTNATVDLGYGSDVDYFGNSLPLDATGISGSKIIGTVTWNPSAIADGDMEGKNVTVTGAATGDVVAFTLGLDLTDLELSGYVLDVNTVRAVLSNSTGGSITLGSSTLTAIADKAPLGNVPLLLATSDTIDIKATIYDSDVDITSGVIEVNVLVMSTAASGFPQ